MSSIYKNTETHICDSIKIQFYMFNRIDCDFDFQKNFYTSKLYFDNVEIFKSKEIPNWIKYKNTLSDIYKNMLITDVEQVDVTLLKKHFSDFKFGDNTNLSSCFVENEFRQYLLYNIKLNAFMNTMEVTLQIPFKCFENEEFIKLFNQDNIEIDLYNCVRNAIVKTGDEDIPDFVENSLDAAFDKAIDIVQHCYNLKSERKNYCCHNNSGNITAVILNQCLERKEFIEQIVLKTNMIAERIEYSKKFTKIDDCQVCFNGRFHSVVTNHLRFQYHFIPVTFQAQFLWSYLATLQYTIEELNVLLKTQSDVGLRNNIKTLISALVEHIQILIYENEVFKRSLENEYTFTYKTFEENWQLNDSLLAKEKYIDYLSDYLNRIQMTKNEIQNIKQNKFLFQISLLQILSLISIWSDFFNLSDGLISLIYDNFGVNISNFFSAVNIFLPIVLITFSFILSFAAIYKSRNST